VPTLLFIDTNIFLDFYRGPGKDGAISLLHKINKNPERIITTEQVEMEYKNKRQEVILQTIKVAKLPNAGNFTFPVFLRIAPEWDSQEVRMISKFHQQIKEQVNKILHEPTTRDPVYQILERFFKDQSDYHLTSQKTVRYRIHRLAFKRFIMGYPPRKPRDTSMGDAINWEWIVECAKKSGKDVVIVSRDSDYGIRQGDVSILNDWLRHEFKDRVGYKRKIFLTGLLSSALERAGIKVSRKEQEEEKELVEEVRRKTKIPIRFSFDDKEECPQCGAYMLLNHNTNEYHCKTCGHWE